MEATTQQIVSSPVESLDNFQKAQLANQLRMMADNQRVLDATSERARRLARWEAENVLGQKFPDNPMSDDMKISIDSPETHNHYHVPPSDSAKPSGQPPQQTSPLLSIAKAALLASGVGIPAAVGLSVLPDVIKAFNPPSVVQQVQQPSGNLLNDYDLFVGDAKKETDDVN